MPWPKGVPIRPEMLARRRATLAQMDRPFVRFWSKVDRSGGPESCWLWRGATIKGYGSFRVANKHYYAHRYAYAISNGPIPPDLELDHKCRTPLCVNPLHLEPVSHGENMLRGVNPAAKHARQTHCKRGHPFDMRNTRLSRRNNGRMIRTCRTCRREAARAYYWRNHGAG